MRSGEKFFESNFGQPWQIGIFLAVFGILLGIADRRPETQQIEDLSMKHAVGVGLAQVLALMPGVSRSGITITAGRFLGLGRDAAARFSFLIYTPIVLGAVLYKAAKLPGESRSVRLAADVPARHRRRRDRGLRRHLGPARLPAASTTTARS